MTTTETTTTPYPTIEDKVKLFEEHGIEIFMHYDWMPESKIQRICFVGDEDVASRVEKLATDNCLKLIRMQLTWDYYSGKPQTPYWFVSFLY